MGFELRIGKNGKGAIFKPFGNWDYGYPENYQVYLSWTKWVFITWGTLGVDVLEGIGLLVGSLLLQENRGSLLFGQLPGTGASYVHNIQAGYCWYHYFIKRNKNWGVFLGSWLEIGGDLGAVVAELIADDAHYGHIVHAEGAAEGMLVAFVLDFLRKRKWGGRIDWFVSFPVITIGIMLAMHIKGTKDIADLAERLRGI